MISKKEKNKRKHKKELKSLKSKLSGPNLVWFESLSNERQFDFLFMWKKHKFKNKSKEVKISYILTKEPVDKKRPWGIKKMVKKRIINYPPSLKHFIESSSAKVYFNASKEKLRNTAIELLLTKNKK